MCGSRNARLYALRIFRVFYKYCAVGKDGKTAMRLGLAKGVVDLEDIIYF